MQIDLSIIIPVYNEEKRIQIYGENLYKSLEKNINKYIYEIIFISDGSTDDTVKSLHRLKNKYPNILSTIVEYPVNQGKGYAIAKGVEKATGKHIFFTDIDLSVDLTILPLAIQKLETNSVVIGSRRLLDSKIVIPQPITRIILGKIFVILANKILGTHYSDLTCGFKGFRSNEAKTLFSNLKHKRWSFDAEILYKVSNLKLSYQEIPVEWTNNLQSKVRVGSDTLRTLKDLCVIRLENIHRKP